MKHLSAIFLLGFSVITGSAFSDEGPVCHKCELIREYNAQHPENNYYWYDDYVKEKQQGTKESSTPAEQKGDQAADQSQPKKAPTK
jgi:hypothetical protein